MNVILICDVTDGGRIIYILKGHLGVVFKMSWSKNGLDLCSAADDRSVRLVCWLISFELTIT
jgi:hypothetical protein